MAHPDAGAIELTAGRWRRRKALRFRAVRLAVLTTAVTSTTFAVVVTILVIAGPAEPTWVVIWFPLPGIIYVTAGCVGWLRRPNNQLGLVLVLGGLAWLTSSLANTGTPALIALGQVFATVPLAVIVHLLLAFPSGRLRRRCARLISAGGYLTTTVLQASLYLSPLSSRRSIFWRSRRGPTWPKRACDSSGSRVPW